MGVPDEALAVQEGLGESGWFGPLGITELDSP